MFPDGLEARAPDAVHVVPMAPMAKKQRRDLTDSEQERFGLERLMIVRPTIPGVTHAGYSARVQAVTEEDHPVYYRLIRAFAERHGRPVSINTPLDVRGGPLVCSPEHANLCFMRAKMDYLLLGNFILCAICGLN